MTREDTDELRNALAAINERAASLSLSQYMAKGHDTPVSKLAEDVSALSRICQVLLNSITAYNCDEPSDVLD